MLRAAGLRSPAPGIMGDLCSRLDYAMSWHRQPQQAVLQRRVDVLAVHPVGKDEPAFVSAILELALGRRVIHHKITGSVRVRPSHFTSQASNGVDDCISGRHGPLSGRPRGSVRGVCRGLQLTTGPHDLFFPPSIY
jgi:hypothetical protein